MSDVQEILLQVRRCGVQISVAGDEMRLNGPIANLGPQLLDTLKDRKTELLDYLKRLNADGFTAVQQAATQGRFPLTRSQQGLWFICQLDNARSAYNNSLSLRISGALDVTALQAALNTLVARHGMLRTRFVAEESLVCQELSRHATIALRCVSAEDSAGDAEQLVRKEGETPFDLEGDLPIRALLIATAPETFILNLTVHHIATDGWSMRILVDEIIAFYHAETTGESLPRPAPSAQYADYAVWQTGWLKSAPAQQQIERCKRRLMGAAALHALPLDKPRPRLQRFRGSEQVTTVDGDHAEQLAQFCKARNVTPFAVLLSVYAVLVARHGNTEEAVIGVPVAGRSSAHLDTAVGLFMNTVVQRLPVATHSSFLDVLAACQQDVRDAHETQLVPFEVLVEALNPARSTSYNPLFQLMFAYQAHTPSSAAVTALEFSPYSMPDTVGRYDLTLTAAEKERGWQLTWQFNTDLFVPATVARMAESFAVLLEACLKQPDTKVHALNLLSPQRLLCQTIEWNATDRDYDYCRRLDELFTTQAQRTPDYIAVISDSESLSYAELLRRSGNLAAALQHNGDRDKPVAILVEKGWQQIVAVLGVLLAGYAYLSVATSWPARRIRDTLQLGSVEQVITQAALTATHSWLGQWRTLLVETSVENTDSVDHSGVARQRSPQDLAYVIFTSGSTGKPKGVAVQHQAAVNTIVDVNRRWDVGPGDRLLALNSLAFDLSVYDIFGPLAAGGAVVMPGAGARRDPERQHALVARHAVSIWNSVPSQMRLFLEYAQQSGADTALPLRLALLSGDWLPVRLARELRARYPQMQLVSLGGATEASIWSIYYPVRQLSLSQRSVPYGKPLGNQRFYVLNSALQHCPVGVEGELYIGGAGLACGYWNDPQLSAERFITHADLQQRLYRTGDQGRFLPNGNIEFLGRLDGQVKISGFRIETGEVEIVLGRIPGIQSVHVTAQEAHGNRYLVAYCHCDPHAPVNEALVRQYAAKHLPEYMVPTQIIVPGALPLTQSGKIDAAQLHELFLQHLAGAPDAPQELTGTCAQLADILSTGFAIGNIHAEQNLFAAGLTSLALVRLAAAITRHFGKPCSMQEILQQPTLSGIAGLLDARQPQVAPAARDPRDDIAMALPPLLPGPLPPMQHVLLTGATGFLGAFLLRDLLAANVATVYCLVRADNRAQARRRIEANASRFGVDCGDHMERVVALPGDVEQARFGLPQHEYENLARSVDSIIHSAAVVNLAYPYDDLRGTNVEGVKNVIRLAGHTRTKAIHHVSTVGTDHAHAAGGEAQGKLAVELPKGNGYEQSKWVAEQLVGAAVRHGMPATIYRVSRLIGDTEGGACNPADLFCRWIAAVVRSRKAPSIRLFDNMLPVDLASRALVAIATEPAYLNRIFHIVHPVAQDVGLLHDYIHRRVVPLETVSPQDWLSALSDSAPTSAGSELAGLLDFLGAPQSTAPNPAPAPRHSEAGAVPAALRWLADNAPPLNDAALDKTIDYLRGRGMLG